MVSVHINERNIYFDDRLYRNHLEIHELITKKDKHFIAIIDGDPGTGKSTLGQQLSAIVDPTFPNTAAIKIHNTVETFVEYIIKCPKNSAVILDEGLNGANARRAMSSLNILLQSVLSEIRQKNLFLIICVPFIFDLDRSVAVGLSSALIHCYENGDGNRYFKFFGKNAKKKLYLNPNNKKFYTYKQRSTFYGRFSEGYVMNEVQYRKFKNDALKKYLPKDGFGTILSSEQMVKQREMEILAKLKANGVSISQMQRWGLGSRPTIRGRLKEVGSSSLEDGVQDGISLERREVGEILVEE